MKTLFTLILLVALTACGREGEKPAYSPTCPLIVLPNGTVECAK